MPAFIEGRVFETEDDGQPMAVVGNDVFVEDYSDTSGGMAGMPHMVHRFAIGQSFRVDDNPVRVIGLYFCREVEGANLVFLPLATAQSFFDKEGQVTHLFVKVKTGSDLSQAEESIVQVLLDVQRTT